MRDYSDIIPIYEQRWAEKPESYYFLPLANAYRAVGQPDRAIDVLQEGLERHPDFHSGRAALAVAYLDADLHEEALAEAKSVLAAQPENLLTRRLLVECYREAGQVEEALAEMKHLLELAPADERLQGALKAMEGYLAEEADEVVAAEAEAPVEEAAPPEEEEVVPIEDFAEILEELEEETIEVTAEEEPEEPQAEASIEEEPPAEELLEPEAEEEKVEPVAEAAAEEEPRAEEAFEVILEEEQEEPATEVLAEEEPPEEEILEEPPPTGERAEEVERPEAMNKFLAEDEEPPDEPPEVAEEEDAPTKDFAEFLAAVDLPEVEPDGEEEQPEEETLAGADMDVEKVPEVLFDDDETILDGDVGVLEEDEPPDEEVKYAETEEVVFADDAPEEPSPDGESQPKATATLGELYAAQGHLEDAASVYRQLLTVEPHNDRYLTRLMEIERELAGPAPAEPEDAPPEIPAEAPELSEGELEALVDDADAVEEIHELFPTESAAEEQKEEEDTSGQVITSLKGWLDNLKRRSEDEPPAVDTR